MSAAEALWLEGDVHHLHYQKVAFRRAALAHDRVRRKVIELYAGVGYLTTLVYRRFYPELVLVEKEAPNFRELVRRVGSFAGVHYYHKDNAAFIAEDLAAHLDFTAVDFDDFGSPGERVQQFFAAVAPGRREPFLLLMTDGGLLALRRRAPINLFKYYLYGPDEVRQPAAALAERFESLQEEFVRRLAGRFGFAARLLAAERNHNESVLYSAYLVAPTGK